MKISRLLWKLFWITNLFVFAISYLFAKPLDPAPKPPNAYQKLSYDLFKQMIEIRSVHDVGTKAVADLLVTQFKAAGFDPSDIHLIPEKNHPNQVNLVIRLRGDGKGKPILWICHLDVVEAKPEDWSVPPFKLTEKDNYFYGRGTADMKDEVAAVATSLIRLKKEGYIPNRDIIVAFTADEEVGREQDGVIYLLQHHPDLINAALIINPDGGTGEFSDGKRLNFGVETSQKTYASFLLEVTNKGGHSSEPREDNAIYILANALDRLSHYQFPFVLTDTTRLYFQRMAQNENGQTRKDMLAVSQNQPDLVAASRLAKNVSFNAILHTTCVPTLLSAGHQENALPQRAVVTIQCRIMPSESVEQTKNTLEKIIANPAIHITAGKTKRSHESPPTPSLLSSVEKVVHSMWPGVMVIPKMIPGSSDSVFTRSAGMPTYGIGGGWNDINDIRFHGKDERHEMNDFYSSIEFTYRLMKELGNNLVV